MATAALQAIDGDLSTLVASTLRCHGDIADSIGRLARVRDHEARAVVLDGDAGGGEVHLLAKGAARLVVNTIDGRLVVIEDYAVGDLFGLTGLFEMQDTAAQVCAVTRARTAAFLGHVFVSLMSRHAAVALAVSRMLVARLSAAQRRLTEAATLSTAGRIHADLLRRAGAGDAAGLGAGLSMAIRPIPKFSEMALALQTTRETVSRTISALEKRGILRRERDALVVVAPHRLEELVY